MNNITVGAKVSLMIQSLNGPMRVVGFVKSITAKGVEVKTQQHGYFVRPLGSLVLVS